MKLDALMLKITMADIATVLSGTVISAVGCGQGESH